jgi:hypothetical protein
MVTLKQAQFLISKDNTSQAIEVLLTDNIINQDRLTLLKARLCRQQEDWENGLLGYEEAAVEKNRINFALLSLITKAIENVEERETVGSQISIQADLVKSIEKILEEIAKLKSNTDPLPQAVEFSKDFPSQYKVLLHLSLKLEMLNRQKKVYPNYVDDWDIVKAEKQYYNKIEELSSLFESTETANRLMADPLLLVKREKDQAHRSACHALLNKRLRERKKAYWASVKRSPDTLKSSSFTSSFVFWLFGGWFWSYRYTRLVEERHVGPYGPTFSEDGYDEHGYDHYGRDTSGFNKEGIDLRLGYDYKGTTVYDQRFYELNRHTDLECIWSLDQLGAAPLEGEESDTLFEEAPEAELHNFQNESECQEDFEPDLGC